MTKSVKVLKVADPIIQSIIFILMAFSFDYLKFALLFLRLLVSWQLISSVFHFFVKSRTKLKVERLAFFFFEVVLVMAYVFLRHHATEKFYKTINSIGVMSLPIYEFTFYVFQALFGIWYYFLSMRELNAIMSKNRN